MGEDHPGEARPLTETPFVPFWEVEMTPTKDDADDEIPHWAQDPKDDPDAHLSTFDRFWKDHLDVKKHVRTTFPAWEIAELERRDAMYRPVAQRLGYDLEEEFEGEWFVYYANEQRMEIQRRVASYSISYGCHNGLRYEEIRYRETEPRKTGDEERRDAWCPTHAVSCRPFAMYACGHIPVMGDNLMQMKTALGFSLGHPTSEERRIQALKAGVVWSPEQELLWQNREEIAVAIGWEPGEAASLREERSDAESQAHFSTIWSIGRKSITMVLYKESARGVLYTIFHEMYGMSATQDRGIVLSPISVKEAMCRCGSKHSVGCPFKQLDRRNGRRTHSPATGTGAQEENPHEMGQKKRDKISKKEELAAKMRALPKLPGLK